MAAYGQCLPTSGPFSFLKKRCLLGILSPTAVLFSMLHFYDHIDCTAVGQCPFVLEGNIVN